MAFSNPIVEAGVGGLAQLFVTKAVTPAEATETYLSRIERLDVGLSAVLDVDAAGARTAAAASADRWREGRPLSPVDGAPLLIKCNIAVAGLPWHAGIGAYRDRIADADAACVARLRAAGAVILGIVNMHEGALGAETDNPWFGRTHNPHRHGHTAGGSSGGSGAAVAAGLCAAALGTDTMGSVRIPSGYCGVFGHKPGLGAISTQGVIPLSITLDHVGVHARSSPDCRAVLEACGDPNLTVDLGDGRIGVLDAQGRVPTEPAVEAAVARTVARAEALGLTVERVALPGYDFGRLKRAGLLVSEAEGHAAHAQMLAAHPEGFSDDFRGMLKWGARQPEEKLAKAREELTRAAAMVREAFAPYAAVLMPTAPETAFPFGQAPAGQADYTAIADFTGQPATAFPVGMSEDGLPLSCQLVSNSDAMALALAQTLALPVDTPEGFAG